MSNNNNLTDRFSEEESISHYTPIIYEVTEDKNGGARSVVGTYCRCKDKITCDCVKKMKQYFNNRNCLVRVL